jgi:hypothetical protein
VEFQISGGEDLEETVLGVRKEIVVEIPPEDYIPIKYYLPLRVSSIIPGKGLY